MDQNHLLMIFDIAFNDLNADYKVDAKLFHTIDIKDLQLQLMLKKALLNVVLEVDLLEKKLTISQINVKSIEDFGINSALNYLNSLFKNEEEVIKNIIDNETSKYIGSFYNIEF